MFGIGWTELVLIIGAGIIVIGPKEMPHLLYKIGQFTRKIKLVISDLQSSLDQVAQEAEVDRLAGEINSSIGGSEMQFEIERQIQAEAEKKKQETDKDAA